MIIVVEWEGEEDEELLEDIEEIIHDKYRMAYEKRTRNHQENKGRAEYVFEKARPMSAFPPYEVTWATFSGTTSAAEEER